MPLTYRFSNSIADLLAILDLQKRSLPGVQPKHLEEQDGFVTVEHDIDLLQKIHGGLGHTVATCEGKVIGYALTMLPIYFNDIEVLGPMFEEIDKLSVEGGPLNESTFLVMGQVCIDSDFRGKGAFRQMYGFMKTQFAGQFDFIITEIDVRNTRSLSAHLAIGFNTIHEYQSDGHHWALVALKTET